MMLDASGLASRADEPIKNFSGGMKCRLDIARALLHQPKLLCADEPTTGWTSSPFTVPGPRSKPYAIRETRASCSQPTGLKRRSGAPPGLHRGRQGGRHGPPMS